MNDKDKYSVDTENLAFPEIHTGKVRLKDTENNDSEESILYETVALPEIHIKKKSDKDKK